jgi:hypothetical protein
LSQQQLYRERHSVELLASQVKKLRRRIDTDQPSDGASIEGKIEPGAYSDFKYYGLVPWE